MSYCRWSTDNYGCDLYCYASEEGWVTNVAGNRPVGEVPTLDMSLLSGPHSNLPLFVEQHRRQHKFLTRCEREPIGGPHDGETFIDEMLEKFRARLVFLRACGYRFPDCVLEDVDEELADPWP